MQNPYSSPPAILCFDLDGTLVDTAPDLLAALDHCLKGGGFAPADHSTIRPIIGDGAKTMITRALESQNVRPDEPQLETLWQTMIEHYRANIAAKSRPFEGATAALERFTQRGVKLAILTNKPLFLTKPLLEALNLTPHFTRITAGDNFPYRKPDPRVLVETLKAAGGNMDNAIMIGDSKTDIDTARNAGIPVIGVTFGYTDQPMADLTPDRLMTHYDELNDLVNELLG